MDNKIFFKPGDIVKLKHDIPNIPIMYVVKTISNENNILLGIQCRWFSDLKELQEDVFNTKDIELV